MTAPHDVRRSGNLITVTLRGDCQSAYVAGELADSALGKGERAESTYSTGQTFGYRAVRR